MKIINYNEKISKNKLTEEAYEVCENAFFPVNYEDVYNHLFGSDNLIIKLLINGNDKLAGFGVFEKINLPIEKEIISMLYLSGMVIDKKYQGKNISSKIIKLTHQETKSNLVSLRTQNIAMATSLISTFPDRLLEFPTEINDNIIKYLRQSLPFQNILENGIIKNCYTNQLYPDLIPLQEKFNILLQPTDAIAIVIEPHCQNQKTLSRFK